MGRWEHFPHEADVGLRGFGDTPDEAFAAVARALTAAMTDPERVRTIETVTFTRTATDLELLLVEWIDALIFELAVGKRLFRDFTVTIEGNTLTATAVGEAVDPRRHEPAVEPKGTTFTALRVAPLPEGGWMAQCIVDV